MTVSQGEQSRSSHPGALVRLIQRAVRHNCQILVRVNTIDIFVQELELVASIVLEGLSGRENISEGK